MCVFSGLLLTPGEATLIVMSNLAVQIFLVITLTTPQISAGSQVRRVRVCDYSANDGTFGDFDLTLLCADGERIFILDSLQGFHYRPTGSEAQGCKVNKPQETCCQLENFECNKSSSNIAFSSPFAFCWNKYKSCKTPAPRDNGSFAFPTSDLCDVPAQYSELAYTCVNESAILNFSQLGSAVGSTVVAKLDASETKLDTPCAGGNTTLHCIVTTTREGSAGVEKVMLVLYNKEQRLIDTCPSLSVRAGQVTSPRVACSTFASFLSLPALPTPLHITLAVTPSNVSSEAWAVVQGSAELRMKCTPAVCNDQQASSFPLVPVLVCAAGGLLFLLILAVLTRTNCLRSHKRKLLHKGDRSASVQMEAMDGTLNADQPSAGQDQQLPTCQIPDNEASVGQNAASSSTAPRDDAIYDYDHLGQNMRPIAAQPCNIYGHLGGAGEDGETEDCYDRLGGRARGATGKSGADASSAQVYGHLDVSAPSLNGGDDGNCYDTARVDVIKEDAYDTPAAI